MLSFCDRISLRVGNLKLEVGGKQSFINSFYFLSFSHFFETEWWLQWFFALSCYCVHIVKLLYLYLPLKCWMPLTRSIDLTVWQQSRICHSKMYCMAKNFDKRHGHWLHTWTWWTCSIEKSLLKHALNIGMEECWIINWLFWFDACSPRSKRSSVPLGDCVTKKKGKRKQGRTSTSLISVTEHKAIHSCIIYKLSALPNPNWIK